MSTAVVLRWLFRKSAMRFADTRLPTLSTANQVITVVDNSRGIPVEHARQRPAGGRGGAHASNGDPGPS